MDIQEKISKTISISKELDDNHNIKVSGGATFKENEKGRFQKTHGLFLVLGKDKAGEYIHFDNFAQLQDFLKVGNKLAEKIEDEIFGRNKE